MNRLSKKSFFLGLVVSLVFVPLFVFAQSDDSYGLKATANAANLTKYGDNVPALIGNVIGTLLSLVSVIFFILMIYGGLRWMLSRGNEDQSKKALDTIIAAIIGIIIVLASYAITTFVFNSVGAASTGGGGGGTPTEQPKKADGAVCTAGTQCTSGVCTGGVCGVGGCTADTDCQLGFTCNSESKTCVDAGSWCLTSAGECNPGNGQCTLQPFTSQALCQADPRYQQQGTISCNSKWDCYAEFDDAIHDCIGGFCKELSTAGLACTTNSACNNPGKICVAGSCDALTYCSESVSNFVSCPNGYECDVTQNDANGTCRADGSYCLLQGSGGTECILNVGGGQCASNITFKTQNDCMAQLAGLQCGNDYDCYAYAKTHDNGFESLYSCRVGYCVQIPESETVQCANNSQCGTNESICVGGKCLPLSTIPQDFDPNAT